MRLIQSLILALAAIAIGASWRPVLAVKPVPPFSYTTVSPDGKFVFVMLANDGEGGMFYNPNAKEIHAIHVKYSKSGLYRNDGSTIPLWTVDWYAREVYVLSEEVHLVDYGGRRTVIDLNTGQVVPPRRFGKWGVIVGFVAAGILVIVIGAFIEKRLARRRTWPGL